LILPAFVASGFSPPRDCFDASWLLWIAAKALIHACGLTTGKTGRIHGRDHRERHLEPLDALGACGRPAFRHSSSPR
jgi:hypothetical protein